MIDLISRSTNPGELYMTYYYRMMDLFSWNITEIFFGVLIKTKF